MKNLVNYIIGFVLLLTLAYVAYYSMNMKREEANKAESIIEGDIKKTEDSGYILDDDIMKIEEKTVPSEEGMIGEINKMTKEQKTNLPIPEMFIELDKQYSIVMQTSEGDISIKLNPKDAPITVNNFVYLAGLGFYDGLTFHRVIDGFMIQGGDPLGTGAGGPGYQFEDEISPNNKNIRGSIAMANAGPATNGSQFFINQVDNNYLDDKHTVFGNVTSGLEVVDKIATMENATQVVIEKVIISIE